MKRQILLLFLMICFVTNAKSNQDKAQIDTLSILFKAKLFTISQHDYDSRIDFLNNIDSMKYEIFGAKEFIFIKIEGRYFCQDKNQLITTNWCDCDFYLCYSIKKNHFYFLGGFKTDNIIEFSKEYYGSSFMANPQIKISDSKLKEFLDLLNRNQLKKAKKYFVKCIDKTP